MKVIRYSSRTGLLFGLLFGLMLSTMTAGLARIQVELNGRTLYFHVP